MFIGHFAVGFAAKKLLPATSLGTAFIACQLLDLVWPVLVLFGVETVRVDPAATRFTPLDFVHYPFSHSLLAAALWSVLFGLLIARKGGARAGAILGGVVISHWLLDFATHRADLPLLFAEPKVGLGLWNSKLATIAIEGAMFAAGVALYVNSTKRKTRKARALLWTLVGFLVAIYLLNAFGPTPPAETPPAAIAGPALSMWLIAYWGMAADRAAAKA